MVEQDERRESFRIQFNATVVCRVEQSDKEYCGCVRDVSASGLFMETGDCPPVDGRCDVQIILQGNRSRLVIDQLAGRVIRVEENGAAIEFDDKMEWITLIPIYYPKMKQLSTASRNEVQHK